MAVEKAETPVESVESGEAGRLSRGERTRLRVLEGALRVLARDGVGGVTHRAVAKEAGVSLSATTYYFKSKSELLADAYRLHFDVGAGRVGALVDANSWRDQQALPPLTVEQMADAFGQFLRTSFVPDNAIRVATQFAITNECARDPELRVPMMEVIADGIDFIADLLERAGSADPVADAETLDAFMAGMNSMWLTRGFDDEFAEIVVARGKRPFIQMFRGTTPPGGDEAAN